MTKMTKIPAEVYGDLESDSTKKEYRRDMRKAKYQAFWIRVRLWKYDHEGSLILLAAAGLILLQVWCMNNI